MFGGGRTTVNTTVSPLSTSVSSMAVTVTLTFEDPVGMMTPFVPSEKSDPGVAVPDSAKNMGNELVIGPVRVNKNCPASAVSSVALLSMANTRTVGNTLVSTIPFTTMLIGAEVPRELSVSTATDVSV